jgi:hypothetical protein
MTMEMPVLGTERLRIRPFVESDLPALLAVLDIAEAGPQAAAERYVRHGVLSAIALEQKWVWSMSKTK